MRRTISLRLPLLPLPPLSILILVLTGTLTGPAWGALASALGGSGYSANLSNNSAIRQQQLICDPEAPDLASASVLYDPSRTLLDSLIDGPGYATPEGVGGLILLDNRGTRELRGLNEYLNLLSDFGGNHAFITEEFGLTELGYVQVFSQRTGTPGSIPIVAPYEQMDYDPGSTGVLGVDTFALFFVPAPTYVDGTPVSYTIFSAPANYQDFATLYPAYQADFMTVNGPGGYTVSGAQINSASVSAAFVPEPATTAVLFVAGIALALRRPGLTRAARGVA